jgi:UDP-3-O-[3-hydroxymyristoyl] glucosamine N-acyltransferase
MFNGYVNRLKHPADFRRLAQDAFLGRNKLVPVGNEVRPGVWIGSGAVIDPSAVISSPVYIGAETHVQAMCTIAEMSTVERGCMVDCGTLVENSSVLADTYLGMGLTVCNSVVGMGKLFHLERNVEVSIADERLVGKITRSKSLLASARSLFRA